MRQYALTGPPYSGKTTIANKLRDDGFTVIEEAETPLVQGVKDLIGAKEARHQIKNNYHFFKTLVGFRQCRFERDHATDDPLIYDRTAIDWIAYCKLRETPVPEILEAIAKLYKFEKVLMFEMLADYDERREQGRFMTKEEAIELQEIITQEYITRGHSPILVPVDTLEQRLISVKSHLPELVRT